MIGFRWHDRRQKSDEPTDNPRATEMGIPAECVFVICETQAEDSGTIEAPAGPHPAAAVIFAMGRAPK
jgi:hypothetical protein